MKIFLLVAILIMSVCDLIAKIIYIEPVKNAGNVSIENNIIIGFDESILSKSSKALIKVTGSLSGIHTGEVIITPDKKKLIFKPFQPFAFNETVEVYLNHITTADISDNKLKYTFLTQVSKPVLNNRNDVYNEYGFLPGGNAVPPESDSLAHLTVTISNNPSPGHLFMNTGSPSFGYTPHLIIANNDGSIFYSREFLPNQGYGQDYKRQPIGLMTYRGFGLFYGENSDYIKVDSFYTGNGYFSDGHDLVVLNNGHALLMSYDPEIIDMSQIVPGGNTAATVVGLIIQEIDENKNVVFQWRSWDHFSILDATHLDLTASYIDYVHGNALDLDNDGNILLTSRHLSEVTKINRTTGDVIWRLGGAGNQFTLINDSMFFSYPHHARRIENGDITLYDNGVYHTPRFSRAVEYHLDEVNKIATLVWQFRHVPRIYGATQGSVQRLRNGNTIICWGSAHPNITEVTPAGVIALEMSLPPTIVTYRVFRDEVDLTLNIKLAIEGFYNLQTNKLNKKDTVTAYLRNTNSPYNIVESVKSVVDSATITGNFRYYNVTSGNFYISVNHRNSLETWSKAGGESFISGRVYLYDFTNSNTQAYGNNLTLKGSKYCIYSGDVNKDGLIEGNDLAQTDNDAAIFLTGYVPADIDGNNFVDGADLSVVDNNASGFVEVQRP